MSALMMRDSNHCPNGNSASTASTMKKEGLGQSKLQTLKLRWK